MRDNSCVINPHVCWILERGQLILPHACVIATHNALRFEKFSTEKRNQGISDTWWKINDELLQFISKTYLNELQEYKDSRIFARWNLYFTAKNSETHYFMLSDFHEPLFYWIFYQIDLIWQQLCMYMFNGNSGHIFWLKPLWIKKGMHAVASSSETYNFIWDVTWWVYDHQIKRPRRLAAFVLLIVRR